MKPHGKGLAEISYSRQVMNSSQSLSTDTRGRKGQGEGVHSLENSPAGSQGAVWRQTKVRWVGDDHLVSQLDLS